MARSLEKHGAEVLGIRIDALSLEICAERMIEWARHGESRYVCACNVHVVVSARRDPEFADVIGGADLRVPDGAPVAWRLRSRGHSRQRRVGGPDLMRRCCARAAQTGLPVFLYGATEATLARLAARLREAYPDLRIAGCLAPPFRPQTPDEDARATRAIADSGARIVFVALGCPKQEKWMQAHRGKVPAVMLGAGAAFDFLAGVQQRAPHWMQAAGLEWLHRLCSEPRRLWRRYLVTNTLFLYWSLGELLGARTHRGDS